MSIVRRKIPTNPIQTPDQFRDEMVRGLQDIHHDCPECGEPLDGLDADGQPCGDCASRGKSCHHCGWDSRD